MVLGKEETPNPCAVIVRVVRVVTVDDDDDDDWVKVKEYLLENIRTRDQDRYREKEEMKEGKGKID